MKGYAAPHSDIDFCLFIDFRQVKGWLRAKTLLGGFRVLGEEFAERFQKQVTKNSKIPTQKVSCDFVLLHQGWVGQMLFDDRMQEMAMLFLPTIGTEVKAYRRDLITKLESVPYGPGIWKTMMEVLWKLESHGFSEEFKEARKKLYPFDLEHAREYFRID